jgi:hypothetical protein
VFKRQGDYWTIRYQGQASILKAIRGPDYLGYLLRHPRRHVYVSELVGAPIDFSAPPLLGSLSEVCGDAVTARRQHGAPILDSQAKTQYKRRIDELRKDKEEAEQFNDVYRASKTRSEMDAIAGQLARCRRTSAAGTGALHPMPSGRARPSPSGSKRLSTESRRSFPRSAATWPRGSRRDTSAPTIRTGIVRLRGSSDFSVFSAVVTRKVTL